MQNKTKFKITRSQRRIIGWGGFVIFFVCFCLPLLFFYYLFDATKVKAMVIEQFNNDSYSVVINGNVEPRSWHGLSLFISNLTVEDKTHHKVLHVNTANCQLSWLDLIVGHYRVKRIALNGLTFYQNALAKGNVATLFNYKAIANSEFKHLRYLSVTNLNMVNLNGKFLIRDGGLQVNDLDTLPQINVNFQAINYNADIKVLGNVNKIDDSGLNFKDISISLHSPKLNGEFHSYGRYDYKTQQLWLNKFNGNAKSVVYDVKVNVDTALLSYFGMSVNQLNASVTKNNGTQREIDLSVKDLKTANFSQYEMDDLVTKLDSVNESNHFSAILALTKPKFDNGFDLKNERCSLQFKQSVNTSESAIFDGALAGNCSYNESSGWLNLALDGMINKSPAKLAIGYWYNVKKPQITINGSVDKLDVNQMMSNANKEIMPFYFDERQLPFGWLKLFDISATLKLKEFSMNHLQLSNVKTVLQMKDSKLALSSLTANIYDGTLSGSGVITPASNESGGYDIAIQNTISKANLEKVFHELFNVNAISGQADLAIDIKALNAVSYQDIHKNLSGKIALKVSNGGFNGVDFSLFLSPENLAAFQNRNAIMTKFTSLNASFNFTNGVSSQSPIKFSSPSIAASGSGVIDFKNTKLDYELIVSSILPQNAQNIKSVSIPVQINGDLFSPKISIRNMTLNSQPMFELYKNKHKKSGKNNE